jgi:hypothetical protein
MTDDNPKHFEENIANLEGTVLLPPTDDDDSDVKDVVFGDPTLMLGKGDPTLTPDQVETITRFIRNYPYSKLTYLCRVLKIKPAEAVTVVMTFEPNNSWWDEEAFADALKQDAEGLTAEDWEPGVSPVTKLTKAQAFTLFDHIMKVKFDSDWDVYDMMHRMNLEREELGTYLVDYCVSTVLSQMKYIGGERKWVFSPETINNAVVNSSWINGWPNLNEFTPYCHYCPSCGTLFTDIEVNCNACGASRCFKPKHPIPIPGKDTAGDDLAEFYEIANLIWRR